MMADKELADAQADLARWRADFFIAKSTCRGLEKDVKFYKRQSQFWMGMCYAVGIVLLIVGLIYI